MAQNSLQPTWKGFVHGTIHDANVLFEACLNGTLSYLPRQPMPYELSSLMESGSVIIYDEHTVKI